MGRHKADCVCSDCKDKALASYTAGDDGSLNIENVDITGGVTPAEKAAEPFGRMWWVKVVDLDDPYAKRPQPVNIACRSGVFSKTFLTNTEVALPEAAIAVLEDAKVQHETYVNIGPDGMSERGARNWNPGMNLKIDELGRYKMVAVQPRFHVQRLRPYQESIVIPV